MNPKLRCVFAFLVALLLLRLSFAQQPGAAVTADGFTLIDSLDELRRHSAQDHAKVRLKPGSYRLDQATSSRFLQFTGHDSHFDLRGVTLLIDTKLFRQFGTRVVPGAEFFYCVIDLAGDRIVFEGLTTENYGDQPGVMSRNKVINISGSGVILRDVEITTSGSSPWGYGSLFGISGGDVRKMNGIRIGYPAKGVQVLRCRVHMRAMGHGIFVQGAVDTLIDDCHVDGLLRSTDDILAQKSGYAFDRSFKSTGRHYVEGVTVGADGRILPGEMIALSEDGIRLYEVGRGGRATGSTTIRRCTIRQMRRGICTGLGRAPDRVIDCEVIDCVAAGFNIGGGDVLENCRANARYAEALSCPYGSSLGAAVDLDILDSRGGLANTILATINGRGHVVALRTTNPDFVPAEFTIEEATRKGYAFYQRGVVVAENITLKNHTVAKVVRP